MKRHQKNEHRPALTTTSARPVAAPTAAFSQPRTDRARKVIEKPKLRQGGGVHRPMIDKIVHLLQSRHRKQPSYLRKPSAEIVMDLRQGTRDHKFEDVVYLAIAVTAKVFAGGKHGHVPRASGRSRATASTAEPQRKRLVVCPPGVSPVGTPAAVVQGVRRRGRRGDRALDSVRRVLFRKMDQRSTDVPPVPKHNDDPEEEWRMDIWRSYGTQQIKPPSPMGSRWAPETIFGSSSAAELPTTPTGADHVVWGPDSPNEPLEEDTVPEVPGWPLFEENGTVLRRDSARRKTRLLVWRHERTQSSPLRVGDDGMRQPSPGLRQEGVSLDDVRLPSPPSASLASLIKLKRELARSKYPKLPRRRRTCNAAQPTTRSTKKKDTSPPNCTVDIDIHAPEDLF